MWLSACADSHIFKRCVIMYNPKRKRKLQIIFGISFILLGILIAFLLKLYHKAPDRKIRSFFSDYFAQQLPTRV